MCALLLACDACGLVNDRAQVMQTRLEVSIIRRHLRGISAYPDGVIQREGLRVEEQVLHSQVRQRPMRNLSAGVDC